MKKTKQPFNTLLLFIVLLVLIAGCKKNKEPDCGCESKSLRIIPESTGLIGKITYKRQLDINDNFYNNKYWIGYENLDICSTCSVSFVVCNEEILSPEIKELKNLSIGSYIEIKFSGEVKELCQKQFNPINNEYYHIFLTKIEKQ